ncbi:hypothetical protein QFZ94_000008 [Paraburkholderia sp. JPY465]|uniref:hypothetical protein n=1 Tax=Paraburkholderia sp. JPY465 TaxID=3042285 RepID=UPI003D259A57
MTQNTRSGVGRLSDDKRKAIARERQAAWPVSDNYFGRRIDSRFLLPSGTCCLM